MDPRIDFNCMAMIDTNNQFKAYIEKYCKNTNTPLEEACKKQIIQDIAIEYLPGGINYRKEEQ